MEQSPEQELQFKFVMLEQQIMAIQQQLQAVEQALVDMTSLDLGLDEIKIDKEILAPIGRGIFTKAKLISEDLTVDIGGKNYVKKSISDTKKLIQEQIGKLEKVREGLNGELEKINDEITRVMISHEQARTSSAGGEREHQKGKK